jgi:hypothetical protein
MFAAFGNKVQIISAPETIEKGVAGMTGQIYGRTVPSLSHVEVIGKPAGDAAVNVYFNELQMSFWFDPDLLEYLDDGEGAIITLGDKKWVKKNGDWIEEKPDPGGSKNKKHPGKKWWEFWK